ncbi:MAG: hypothetical protein KBF76_02010 [Verrucomicrobiales bacterium]|jgi:DNA repair photolyase|nr:hypothetical protein [Verrucomicrobiales bacterium]
MKLLTPILLSPKSSGLAIPAIPEEVHFPDFCSSDLPHIADNRRCTTSRRYRGSSLANTTLHRNSGEHPAFPEGTQGFGRTRSIDGLREFRKRTKLNNQNQNNSLPAPDDKTSDEQQPQLTGFWGKCATIQPNNFKFKSLSNWSFNTAVGCAHACRFCYVPSVSTIKLSPKLEKLGVDDPDSQWGDYVYLRHWDEGQFLRSLSQAENTPVDELNPDGNRAVIYCSTTDPYQVLRHPDPKMRRKLADHASHLVRRSLELIRDESTLNVRILTRSPLAHRDFDLYRSFGDRLVFGMSLPTLDNKLAKIYEPHAPSPSQRLKTLHEAKEAGLHVFVAMAPTYPNGEGQDLRNTLTAIRELDPITVFHEPINIRSENVKRIEEHARSLGVTVKTDVFDTRESWADYALHALYLVEIIAEELGMTDRLHLWPDKSLGSKWMLKRFKDPDEHLSWLNHWWSRISEWPSAD